MKIWPDQIKPDRNSLCEGGSIQLLPNSNPTLKRPPSMYTNKGGRADIGERVDSLTPKHELLAHQQVSAPFALHHTPYTLHHAPC
ncbi:hypothetical protein EON63_25320 [archaeon]|nr:MAG: hypothetical protein EON63_25320 [archaeon]